MQVITDQDFRDKTKSGVVVIDFYADWCGPCRALTPLLEEIMPGYEGKATLYKLDVDANPVSSQEFGVMSIPTVLIMKDGVEVKRIVGLNPKSTYIDAVDAALN